MAHVQGVEMRRQSRPIMFLWSTEHQRTAMRAAHGQGVAPVTPGEPSSSTNTPKAATRFTTPRTTCREHHMCVCGAGSHGRISPIPSTAATQAEQQSSNAPNAGWRNTHRASSGQPPCPAHLPLLQRLPAGRHLAAPQRQVNPAGVASRGSTHSSVSAACVVANSRTPSRHIERSTAGQQASTVNRPAGT